jgi:toxin ParE1/3/4
VARVVIAASADADTAYIIADLGAKAGANIAARYDADFGRLYERLSNHPKSGAPRPSLGTHVRICVVSPYVVIYEHIEADDTVAIMRLAHGRRKIGRKFLRGAGKAP